jgi:TrmH family RNA methyltransferase
MPETPKTISSPANPAVKRLKSLSGKKYRDEEQLFIVEGLRHVKDALAGGFALEVLAFSPRAAKDAVGIKARESYEMTDELLSRITGRDNTQPLIGAFRPKVEKLDDVKAGLWVALEGIRDPGNLGTIIRTTDAVKAEGVILLGECCDAWSPEAVRGSMGSFARVKIAAAPLKDFISWRKGWTGGITGTHLRTDTDYRAAKYPLPHILLMGSEANGLSEEAAKACGTLVKIPMAGGAESLNLAVSTGIMLYEISRARI